MDKAKKYLALLFVAIFGGLISVGAYKVIEQKQYFPYDNFMNARKASYDIRNVTVPTFDFSEVSEAVMPTVVHIKTIMNAKQDESAQNGQGQGQGGQNPFDFFGSPFNMPQVPRGPQQASGSGVIISTDGYIVTNNHVVADADNIDVVLYDKRSYKADVIGRDPNTDMALIKINADGLQPIKIGNSDESKVGQWVLAVGNPFNLTSTVTAGIISAKGRNIQLLGGGASIESFIQTDAAVNPGNSGGALVNTKGELIGINTAIATQTGQYEGYSFAVPSNLMKKVINDFKEFGEVQRGFLGVAIKDIDSKIAEEKGLPKPEGVLVESINDNSAAEDAGIKKGDVILKIDDHAINSVSELQELIGTRRPGDHVKIALLRSGKDKDFDVILKNKDGKTGIVTSETSTLKKELGVNIEPLSKDEMSKLKIQHGVKTDQISRGKFRDAGIPEGFIITSVDKTNIYTPNDVYKALDGKTGGILIEGYLPTGEKKYYVLEMSK
jgi:serine protease Do